MTDPDLEQEKIKKNVLSRMKRIEGQIRGVQRMIEEGKECSDILVQVRAVKSALNSANKQILRRYLLKCYVEALDEDDTSHEAMNKAVKVLVDYVDG